MKSQALLIAVIAFAVSCILTKLLIPFFHRKQFGQYIREEGPASHQGKAGTPTMGGLAIMAGILFGIAAGEQDADALVIILTMLAFGAIGFLDDYEKIAKRNNLGLKPKQKLALQVVLSLGIGIYMIFQPEGSVIFLPFAGTYISLGWLYLPFVVFTEVAMANGVNLTDGLDGLASSVTAIVALTFALIGFRQGEDWTLVVSGCAIAGALLGFLVFNRYPARIFMGDTGSMALGGVLSAVAIVTQTELLLPLAGLVYVAEALSVIIQVLYFRKTGGKRFFRMAPIHHHFELGGLKEYRVVVLFSAFTLLCCVIAYCAA